MAHHVNYDVADIPKKCVVCKATFTEFENTGRWLCFQHEGEIENGRFTCCNLPTIYRFKEDFYNNNISYSKRGCVPCDHRAVLHNFDDTNDGLVAVPLEQAPLLNTIPEARVLVRRPDGSRQVFIRRFDKATSTRLRARMGLHRLSHQSIYCKDKDLGGVSLSTAWISNRRKK